MAWVQHPWAYFEPLNARLFPYSVLLCARAPGGSGRARGALLFHPAGSSSRRVSAHLCAACKCLMPFLLYPSRHVVKSFAQDHPQPVIRLSCSARYITFECINQIKNSHITSFPTLSSFVPTVFRLNKFQPDYFVLFFKLKILILQKCILL